MKRATTIRAQSGHLRNTPRSGLPPPKHQAQPRTKKRPERNRATTSPRTRERSKTRKKQKIHEETKGTKDTQQSALQQGRKQHATRHKADHRLPEYPRAKKTTHRHSTERTYTAINRAQHQRTQKDTASTKRQPTHVNGGPYHTLQHNKMNPQRQSAARERAKQQRVLDIETVKQAPRQRKSTTDEQSADERRPRSSPQRHAQTPSRPTTTYQSQRT